MAIKKIEIQGKKITYLTGENGDYICITDMVRGMEGDARDYIRNWMRMGVTLEFLGVWEKVHNPDFNVVEYHHIKSEFVSNTFLMSTKKWIERTGAIGLQAKAGRYGGTYVHSEYCYTICDLAEPRVLCLYD